MIRKVAIVLVLVFSVHLLSGISASAFVPFRDVVAQSAVLVEKDNGYVLFEYNQHERYPADSLTKIMTLLLAAYEVENNNISDNELIEMTEAAWEDIGEDSPTQDIQPGEFITFIDLMYAAYVGNANEACNMIALRIAGSIEAFVRMMNAKAVELGCVNTRFVNPHGQYDEEQYTTASDIVLMYSEGLNNQLFTEIASTFRHVTESSEDSDARTLTSSNALLNQSSVYYYRFCVSGISSTSVDNRQSLVASALEEDLSLISVVLGSEVTVFEDESTDMRNFSETQRLFLWGYSQFAWRDIVKTSDIMAKVPVLHGRDEFVNVRPTDSLTLLLSNTITTDSFEKTVTIFSEKNDTPLEAPVSAGDVLGELVITREGVEYARMDLIANTDVELNRVELIRREVVALLLSDTARNIIIVLVVLVLIYVALVVRYSIVRANRLRRIKNAKNDIIRDRHQNFRE